MHLFQFHIIDAVTNYVPEPMVVWIAGSLFYGTIILISAVIARFYSEPLNRFIRRFYAEPIEMRSAAASVAIRGASSSVTRAEQPA